MTRNFRGSIFNVDVVFKNINLCAKRVSRRRGKKIESSVTETKAM